MAIKPSVPFTIFSPKALDCRPATEVRFSRWNNANAEKFLRHERAQKEIEDEIRRERRYESASKIADISESENTFTASENESFKSVGTPSSPSRPSIPGKASKYSKNPNPRFSHPAFRRVSKVSKVSQVPADVAAGVTIGEKGVSYRIPNAPFEFQYSYTETPKVKPLALREQPFVPFGPNTMPRPWTGRAPLPPSKKKLPEFDSFRLPPPHKKGVKPVQKPGPYLAGSGPRYAMSREEILGEPLTEEEIKELIQGCMKSKRQLNMGRDGLTHNMLDNIHAHWKRRRVCKIKCKGVCTVDMDNVYQQLEEKTGGKIIYSRGGVIFLFRGRNYNYRTRPRFPIMLWKPVTPVYPRLIQHIPEGLTQEEAKEMRKKGRKLPPICKLGKNGVYKDLVKHVREAFEECELVRINCQGMNASDYKKIGAKLKDLVPCVLVSFEQEHILVWRGRDWKSSLEKLEDDCKAIKDYETDDTTSILSNYVSSPSVEGQERSDICAPIISINDVGVEGSEILLAYNTNDQLSVGAHVASALVSSVRSETGSDDMHCADDQSATMPMDLPGMKSDISDTTQISVESADNHEMATTKDPYFPGLFSTSLHTVTDDDKLQDASDGSHHLNEMERSRSTCTEEVIKLWRQAVEGGSAIILDEASLDANIVYEKAFELAKDAPHGPVFKRNLRKVKLPKSEKQESQDFRVEEIIKIPEKIENEKRASRNDRMKGFEGHYPDIVPIGSLEVDELAKLLA